jgi:hypothetical protein
MFEIEKNMLFIPPGPHFRLLLPNVVTYTAAMAAFDKSSQWQRALAIFDAEKLGCNERSCSAAMYLATEGKWVGGPPHDKPLLFGWLL